MIPARHLAWSRLHEWTILSVYSKMNDSTTGTSIWPRRDPIICCRDPTVCQDEKFSYKHSIIPARRGVFHLYIKHTILFCLAKFFSKVGLKPEPVQPFHYHINRHIQYIKSRRLYFTCQGERAATQWLERPWKSRGGVIKRTEPTIKYYKIQSMST